MRRAFAEVEPFWRDCRPNGQPPAGWLVDTAAALGGLLAGQVGDNDRMPERLRVDAVCVAGDRAGELARAVDAVWPEVALGERALDLALAEGWEQWDAEQPIWTGNGRDLLDGITRAPVVGLWWD